MDSFQRIQASAIPLATDSNPAVPYAGSPTMHLEVETNEPLKSVRSVPLPAVVRKSNHGSRLRSIFHLVTRTRPAIKWQVCDKHPKKPLRHVRPLSGDARPGRFSHCPWRMSQTPARCPPIEEEAGRETRERYGVSQGRAQSPPAVGSIDAIDAGESESSFV